MNSPFLLDKEMIEPGWNCDDNNGQKCIFGNVSVSGENRWKLWAREKESWARRNPGRQSWQQYCQQSWKIFWQQSLKLWVWRRTGQKETLTMLIILTTILTTILSIWRDPFETLSEREIFPYLKILIFWYCNTAGVLRLFGESVFVTSPHNTLVPTPTYIILNSNIKNSWWWFIPFFLNLSVHFFKVHFCDTLTHQLSIHHVLFLVLVFAKNSTCKCWSYINFSLLFFESSLEDLWKCWLLRANLCESIHGNKMLTNCCTEQSFEINAPLQYARWLTVETFLHYRTSCSVKTVTLLHTYRSSMLR